MTTSAGGVGDPRPSASPWSRSFAVDTTAGMMQLHPDFSEFIASLRARDVRFLIVGGYAVAAHGHPRYTADLDIWLWAAPDNAKHLLEALDDFGFGGLALTIDDFTAPDHVVQLGYPPVRIDLITSLDGVEFEDCFERREELELGGALVPVIGVFDLRRNKRTSGRPQDLADLDALEQ